MLIALPTFSSGATVKNDLRSFESAQTRATSANPQTEPPLHGTNPHAQGTAAVVDLTPSATRPFSDDPVGRTSGEDVVIGRSRGEQRADGTYHGHVTVAALFGNELIGRDTVPGQTVDEAIAEDLLQGICTGLGVCIDVVRVRSATTSSSSLNSFSLATAALRRGDVPALAIGAAQSIGNITSDGTCQTANGASSVVDVAAGAAIAEVSESSSASRACRGAAPTQTNTSRVVELGQTGLDLPAPGCANGTPDTQTGLPPLLPIVCNADDSSSAGGIQATAPYGVRNALDVYVLSVGGTALSQVSTAQSESLAVAPAAVTTPPTTTTTTPAATTPTPAPTATTPAPTPTVTTPATTDDGGDTGEDAGEDESGNEGAGDEGGDTECSDGVDNDGDGKIDFGNDPGCSSASDDSEADNVSLGGNELPFTGTDVIVLGLAGSILLAAGLTLRGPARRREDT